MKLSIIILNYNTRGMLRQCLKAIYYNPPKFDYEIIVVDNASKDGSTDMVKKDFPNAKLIALKNNYGYAGGNNYGLRAGLGEYLAILNPDVLAREGSFDKLVDFLDQNKDVGIVGPKLLNPDHTLQYSCFHFPKLFTPFFRRTFLGFLPFGKKMIDEYLMMDWAHDEARDVDWLLGGAIIIRHEAYDEVGPLDERFFLYFDDVDYSRRMHESSWRVVYCPEAEMIHFHQRESAGSLLSFFTNKVARIHVVSAIRYFLKYRNT